LAVGFIGVCSTLGTSFIIFIILYYKMYRQLNTRLVLYLCSGDLVQALGGACSLGMIYHAPQIPDSLCVAQAVLYQMGDIVSAGMSLYIAFYVWANIHFMSYSWITSPGKKFEYIAVISSWGTSILFIVIGWIRYGETGVPFYTPVGWNSWCWISDQYPAERLGMLYALLFIECLVLFCLYIHIIIALSKTKPDDSSFTDQNDKKKRRVAQKMIGFPVAFFFAFVPLGIDRFVSYSTNGNVELPSAYVAFAVCMISGLGFMNSVLYGITKRLYQKIFYFRKPRIESTDTKSTVVLSNLSHN